MITETPLVSIICPTYNHERFIAQTLEGFVMQKTNFPFEIIVHDDASTDATPDIMKEYEHKYPNLFANIYQTENQLSQSISSVTKITFAKARGKYIALCEGDDFWIDPNKLQKQVDFLESNPDYSICFHALYEQFGNNRTLSQISNNEETFTLYDLSKKNLIATNSVVFRNQSFIELPTWLEKVVILDYVIHLLNAKAGKIKYLPEPMGVYRRHNGGIYGGKGYRFQCENLLMLFDILMKEFKDNTVVKNNFAYQQAFYATELANLYLQENDMKTYLKYLRLAFNSSEVYFEEWLTENHNRYIQLTESKEVRIGKALLKPFRKLKKIIFKGN